MSDIVDAIGYGLTVEYGDAATFAASVSWTEITEVVDFEPPDYEANVVDTSHMKSTGAVRTYKAGMIKPGTAKLTILWQPTLLAALKAKVKARTNTGLRVTYNDGGTPTVEGYTVVWKKVGGKRPMDDEMVVDIELQASGDISITAGAQ